MENAGRGATERLLALRVNQPGLVVIVVGPGNNGGDGLVLARRLQVLGFAAEVWSIGDPARLSGDARVMWDAYVGLGGFCGVVTDESGLTALERRLAAAGTIVDALFGTGLTRAVEGLQAAVIDRINRASAFVLALDVPSGLDANRGRILGCAVTADATVTFGAPKLGHFTSEGANVSGRLEVVDIGVPASRCAETGYSATFLGELELAPRWRPRAAASHKGSAGRVAIIGGHPGTIGAALLAAQGALRTGAGLVTHVGVPETIAAIETRVLETMTLRLDPAALETSLAAALEKMNAIVLGPGLGLGESQRRIVQYVVERAPTPVVVDADALTLLSESPDLCRSAAGPRILLPHRGELARLLGCSISVVEDDPFAAIERVVASTNAVVVLKGAYTFVGAPNQKTAIVAGPCPALGTAGSGDVLSGVVAALAVQHAAGEAAAIGVHLHHRAGAIWTDARQVDRGLIASDIADGLPVAVAELARAAGEVTE
jgi:NAD(P)H-hydrate epimerase